MSVVGTASESESESSSSESDSSSEELDSGVGSLTTFLDFFSCENVRRDPKWTTRKEKMNSRQGRPWKPSSPSSRRLPWRQRQEVLPWMRTWMLLPFCLLDDWYVRGKRLMLYRSSLPKFKRKVEERSFLSLYLCRPFKI